MSLAQTDVIARFFTKVELPTDSDGCWRWTGRDNGSGYGRFWFNGRAVRAHRFSYELFVGSIPEGLTLDHRCHGEDRSCDGGDGCQHRLCVNPDHLEPVTNQENVLRGLSFAGRKARQTHCTKGHALSGDNLVTYKRGDGRGTYRKCRRCERETAARRYDRKRQALGADIPATTITTMKEAA